MNEYSYKVTPKGNVTWYKDKVRVSKKEVPLKFRKTILRERAIESVQEITAEAEGKEYIKAPLTCIFCKKFATKIRSVNVEGRMEEIKLCDDCYFEKTLGSIVKQLRKKV